MRLANKDKAITEIINASIVVFSKFGYKKTTMEDIGNAVGKSKHGLYYYFKNKEDVFKAVVEKEAQELYVVLKLAISKSDDPIKKLKSYFIARMNTLNKVSNFYDVMKNELFDNLQFINEARLNFDKAEFELVKNILIDGNNKKCFSIKNVEGVAKMIVTTLKSLEIPFFVQNNKSNLKKNIETVFELISYGIVIR